MDEGNFFRKLSWLDKIIEKMRFRRVYAEIPSGAVLIDFGAARGNFLRSVEDIISKGFAFDRYSLAKTEGKISYVPFDFDTANSSKTATLKEGSADVVTALAVIEHVLTPETLVAEALRMLKKGGKFVMTTPTPRSRPILEFLAFRLGVASREEILEHRRYLWGFELRNLVLDAGFSTATWREFEFGMNTILVAIK